MCIKTISMNAVNNSRFLNKADFLVILPSGLLLLLSHALIQTVYHFSLRSTPFDSRRGRLRSQAGRSGHLFRCSSVPEFVKTNSRLSLRKETSVSVHLFRSRCDMVLLYKRCIVDSVHPYF